MHPLQSSDWNACTRSRRLAYGEGGITSDIEGYLFGNLLLIDYDDLDLILYISILSLISLFFLS